MTHETSSIDDILASTAMGNSPNAVENKPDIEAQTSVADSPQQEVDQISPSEPAGLSEPEAIENTDVSSETDDYGNERAPSRTYTEEEVNERINRAMRERMARERQNHGQINAQNAQNMQNQPQNSSQGQNEDWRQELDSYIDSRMEARVAQQAREAQVRQEQAAQAEFEGKFRAGMGRFSDYVQVVGSQPITDAMTVASRAMSDPAAFFYAASKRAPQELQRISQIQDQYAQMVEIGKLEERMRQSRPSVTTKTPKPIGRAQEDSAIPYKSDTREPTIEEQIAAHEAKVRAIQNARRR